MSANSGIKSYFVETYGCQMNAHDSERIAGLLEGAGMVPVQIGTDADVIVFNTCAVRENADNKLYGNLSHLANLKEDRKSTRLNSSHIPLSRMPSSA